MFLALGEWVLGYAEQALASGTEGMVLAERLALPEPGGCAPQLLAAPYQSR